MVKIHDRKFVSVDPEKCVGCQICEYVCSWTKEKAFNPMKSRIRVVRVNQVANNAIIPPARMTRAAMSKRLGSSTRRNAAPITILPPNGLRQSEAGQNRRKHGEKTGRWMAAHSFIAKTRQISNRRKGSSDPMSDQTVSERPVQDDLTASSIQQCNRNG